MVGLNRNILECKCRASVYRSRLPVVLIETYWNVNQKTLFANVISSVVLIETYWNVNVKSRPVPRSCSTVLIETYWNVNWLVTMRAEDFLERLNRNILECKSKRSFCEWNLTRVLIETYWNVNANAVKILEGNYNVLIETYWNVN